MYVCIVDVYVRFTHVRVHVRVHVHDHSFTCPSEMRCEFAFYSTIYSSIELFRYVGLQLLHELTGSDV